MGWNKYYPSTQNFVADPNSIVSGTGRQVDWAKVPETYKNGTKYTVKVNDADAATGDTALTVDALPVALPLGATLDFGVIAADAYAVVVGAAGALANATSVPVDALPVAIPAGTTLHFGSKKFALLTADAAAGATSITVEALPTALVDDDAADYPGVAQRQLVKVAAAAAVGATALTVLPLAGPILNDAEATYIEGGTGDKEIPAGTTMCQLSTGKIVPRAARPGSEEAMGLLATSAQENNRNDAKTGYGVIVGGVIYEDLLPETITSYKTELATNGLGWVWETYSDSREA